MNFKDRNNISVHEYVSSRHQENDRGWNIYRQKKELWRFHVTSSNPHVFFLKKDKQKMKKKIKTWKWKYFLYFLLKNKINNSINTSNIFIIFLIKKR